MLEARLIVRLHDPVVRVAWLVHSKATANERNGKKKKESDRAWLRSVHLSKNGKREKNRGKRLEERRNKKKDKKKTLKGTRNEGTSKASRGSYTNFPVEVPGTPWVHLEEPFLEDPSI